MDHSGYLLGKAALDNGEYPKAADLFLQNESQDVLCSYGLYALIQMGYIVDATQNESIAQRFAQALPAIYSLADSGDAEALFVLGVLNERMVIANSSKDAARHYYAIAYERGNLRAGFNLAVLLQESHNCKNINEAIKIYEALVSAGNIEAVVNLGCIHMDYLEYQDFSLARKYFEIAAKKNDSIGLFRLGVIYEQGLGVDKDLRKAEEYYKLSRH